TGLVTFNADGSFSYDPNGQFDSLAPGDTALDTFSYTVTDSNGGTDTATVTITVMGANDAPIITDLADDAVSYDQGSGAIVIDQGAGAVVSDADSGDFDGGNLTVSIADGGASNEDVLWIENVGMSAGEIGFVPYTETVRDEFNSSSYTGNEGTQSWSNSWQELGESDGSNSGLVEIDDNVLEIWAHDKGLNGVGASREVDLSGAMHATLTFDWYVRSHDEPGTIRVEVSEDGGASWHTLDSFDMAVDTGWASESYDISGYRSANTQIRFVGFAARAESHFHADNIQVSYETGGDVYYGGTLIGTAAGGGNGNDLVVSLNSNATSAAVSELLRNVSYENTNVTNATAGTRTVRYNVSDGDGGTSDDHDAFVTVGRGTSLLISTLNDVSSSGAPGLDSWTDAEALRIGDPHFTLDPSGTPANTTDGTFSSYFNLENFTASATIDGLHYVTQTVTVGSTTPVVLQEGDLLLSTDQATTLPGLTVDNDDVFAFRPTVPGDYSSGSFFMVAEGLGAGSKVKAFTLVETQTNVGGAILDAGSFIYRDTGSPDIQHVVVNKAGSGATYAAPTTLIDVSDININSAVSGLELIERTTTIAGTTLQGGSLLVSLQAGDTTTGDNAIVTKDEDIFALNVTSSGPGTTAATATLIFDGSDVNLDTADEDVRAIAMIPRSNLAPVVADQDFFVNENSANGTVVDTVVAIDPDAGDTLSYAITAGDPGGIFDIDVMTGEITVADGLALDFESTPSYSLTVEVQDEVGVTDTATITVRLVDVNEAPTASADAYATDEDTVLNVALGTGLVSNDTDPDTLDLLTVQSIDTTATTGLVTFLADGSFSYDPNGQFESLAVGETAQDTFSYTVTDSNGGTDTATVTITVTGVNDAPTANSDAYGTDEETVLNVAAGTGLVSNDTDPDASDVLTVQGIDTTATTGLVTFNADGSFSYDPNGQFESLAVGETALDTFSYTVTDSNGGTDTATVTITLTGVNDAPTANADAYTTDEDTLLNVAAGTGLVSNDTDPDASDVLTVQSIDTTATTGLVTFNADGSFS
ncbi:MAG: hypothetical protein DRJ50_11605, partial [Actinobacteria bacterium]